MKKLIGIDGEIGKNRRQFSCSIWYGTIAWIKQNLIISSDEQTHLSLIFAHTIGISIKIDGFTIVRRGWAHAVEAWRKGAEYTIVDTISTVMIAHYQN